MINPSCWQTMDTFDFPWNNLADRGDHHLKDVIRLDLSVTSWVDRNTSE